METSIITDMTTKYLSTKEAAERLGISRGYIYYLRDTGKIKALKIGEQWVISEKELERYKSTRNQKTEGDK